MIKCRERTLYRKCVCGREIEETEVVCAETIGVRMAKKRIALEGWTDTKQQRNTEGN